MDDRQDIDARCIRHAEHFDDMTTWRGIARGPAVDRDDDFLAVLWCWIREFVSLEFDARRQGHAVRLDVVELLLAAVGSDDVRALALDHFHHTTLLAVGTRLGALAALGVFDVFQPRLLLWLTIQRDADAITVHRDPGVLCRDEDPARVLALGFVGDESVAAFLESDRADDLTATTAGGNAFLADRVATFLALLDATVGFEFFEDRTEQLAFFRFDIECPLKLGVVLGLVICSLEVLY